MSKKQASCSMVTFDEYNLITSSSVIPIDWSLCCLCQKNENPCDLLVCPFEAKTYSGAGYRSLAKDLEGFKEIGEISTSCILQNLDDGQGIEGTLIYNKARYHKKCRNDYNSLKLKRLKLRKIRCQDELEGDDNYEFRCLLCEELTTVN